MVVERTPLLAGAASALLAALSFGVTAPLIARTGGAVGPLTTACLLYAGAAASSLFSPPRAQTGAPLRASHAGRLVAVALLGAALAPSLLAWGLTRVGGVTGSLLLNLEGAFTVVLAWLVFREPIGRRVQGALALMSLGGALLSFEAAGSTTASGWGALAVAGATLAWSLDNALSRPLAQHNPLAVVALKGALGAALTGSLSRAFGEPLPEVSSALLLLACGATGYGASLRLYLRAQRQIGAARTGSIFSVAPFVGAALGLALDPGRAPLALTAVAATCFALGLWLHLTERHRHLHRHEVIAHDHPHRHDDGHHDHVHDPPFSGEHSHHHRHEALEHDHEHAPDIHHEHRHS